MEVFASDRIGMKRCQKSGQKFMFLRGHAAAFNQNEGSDIKLGPL